MALGADADDARDTLTPISVEPQITGRYLLATYFGARQGTTGMDTGQKH